MTSFTLKNLENPEMKISLGNFENTKIRIS